MKNNREMLSSVLKTTQLSQTGIRSVLDLGMQSTLRRKLEFQLQAYNMIEADVYSIASQRGWELQELDPAVRFLVDLHSRAKVNGKYADSLIAGMIIQRSTKGMIREYKNLHQLEEADPQIQTIFQRLLDREADTIRQMKGFL